MPPDATYLVSELTHIPLFSALDEKQLKMVVDSAILLKISGGEILFRQRQPADRFFMVRTGQVQLSRMSEEGDEKVIDIVHARQIFAEAVMFMDNQRYPVNAQAIQDSELWAFDNETFRTILKESVNTCFRLLAVMSQRLHIQLTDIDSLSLHNATYRFVHYLLKSLPENTLEQTEVTLNYPKNVLASRLSIKPETFSRIMARLKLEGILDVQGNQIILRDVNALRKMVND